MLACKVYLLLCARATMYTKKSDIVINNALTLMATLPAVASQKAIKQAAVFLGGKKAAFGSLNAAADNDKLLFRLVSLEERAFDEFDVPALIRLHAVLFDGIRPDAGKLRTVPAEAGGSSFADPSLIAGSLKRLLSKLKDSDALSVRSKDDFATSLTYCLSEMFLLCPFRTGSLLTLCAFLGLYALSKGYRIDYFKFGGARLGEAVMTAFITDEKTELYVLLAQSLEYENLEKDGEEIPVVDALQVKRELRRDRKPKMLVKKDKPKKEKSRPERNVRPEKKVASERKKPEPVKKTPRPSPTKKPVDKDAKKPSVEDEMTAAKAAIAAETEAARAAIVAEMEAARAAIEAEKAAAKAEMELRARERVEAEAMAKESAEAEAKADMPTRAEQNRIEKMPAAKKSGAKTSIKSARGKSSLKKALARTVSLLENMPEAMNSAEKFSLPEAEKENSSLLLSSSQGENTAAKADSSLPKLLPIKKIERKESPPPQKEIHQEKSAPEEKISSQKEAAPKEETSSAEMPASEKEIPPQKATASKEEMPPVEKPASEDDKLAQKVAEMSELPSNVLKKAAEIKEKIELLQKELKDVLKGE